MDQPGALGQDVPDRHEPDPAALSPENADTVLHRAEAALAAETARLEAAQGRLTGLFTLATMLSSLCLACLVVAIAVGGTLVPPAWLNAWVMAALAAMVACWVLALGIAAVAMLGPSALALDPLVPPSRRLAMRPAEFRLHMAQQIAEATGTRRRLADRRERAVGWVAALLASGPAACILGGVWFGVPALRTSESLAIGLAAGIAITRWSAQRQKAKDAAAT